MLRLVFLQGICFEQSCYFAIRFTIMSQSPPDGPEPSRLRPSGGFRKLRAFQTTRVMQNER